MGRGSHKMGFYSVFLLLTDVDKTITFFFSLHYPILFSVLTTESQPNYMLSEQYLMCALKKKKKGTKDSYRQSPAPWGQFIRTQAKSPNSNLTTQQTLAPLLMLPTQIFYSDDKRLLNRFLHTFMKQQKKNRNRKKKEWKLKSTFCH